MHKSSYITTVLWLIFLIKSSYAVGPGSIVYDPTNAANMATQAEQLEKSIEHQTDMLEAIGKGDFNPSVINYIDNMYQSCGGKKYGLPEWFPKYDIPAICADEEVILESAVNDYKNKMLPLSTDTHEEMVKKKQYQLDNGAKVRGYALGKSEMVLEKSPKTSETIEQLSKAAKEAKSQIELQKIQLQVDIVILQELQKMNESQALILQIMGWKN
ncbi:VirB5 protein family [Candidatus Hepatincola sp. Av]